MKKSLHISSEVNFSISLLFLIWSITLLSQEKNFKKITVQDGLSHSTVYDIEQDGDGFIWFGTREGLNKYDGKTIKTYYEEEGLSSNQINTIKSTSRGLLIGTYRGLDVFLPEYDRFEKLLSHQEIEGAVSSIFESENNEILVGTTNGLFKIDKEEEIQHLIKDISVQEIESFKTNVLWVALNKRILLINDIGERIREYQIPESPGKYQDGSTYAINTIYKDSKNNLFVGTTRGLFYLNQETEKFQYVNLTKKEEREAEVIRSIKEDNNGLLWLGTESGIFTYNKKTNTVIHYGQSFNRQPESLSDKAVYSIFVSDEDIVWIGTYFGGVNYTSPKSKGITKYTPSDYRKSISGKAVSEIISLQDGKLWIGTEDGGINILDKESNQFSFLNSSDGLSSNNIHSLHEDNRGNIWIGTFLGGINKYEKKTGKISVYKYSGSDSNSISNNYVYSILQDHSGRLWIGTQNGLNLYNYESKDFDLFMPEVLGDKFIYDILEDSENNLWFCTRNSGIFKLENNSEKIVQPGLKLFSDRNLQKQIVSAYEDKNGDIWFGSLNEGVLIYDKAKEELLPFHLNNELPNSNVYGIIEDKNGHKWMSTNQGLSIYNPEKEKLTHLNVEDGLTTNQFNFKSFYKDENGLLYFGSVNGLNIINPELFNIIPPAPPLYFTGLKLFNKEVSIDEDNLLKRHINYVDKIEFKHNQDVFSIDYGAVNYLNEKAIKYAYKLDGFDKNWNLVGNITTATYTNLPPGEYIFRIKTLPLSNNENERKIALSVLPPFWKTDLAYLIYFFLVILLIYAYWKFVRFIHNQKLAVQLERLEKEKISELNRHKLNFFTFISHEFKTPLTLIIASAEKFFRDKVTTSAPPEELVSIKKSANKLNRLIHQLLEFRRIETDHAELDLRKGDIILFLKDTFMAFGPLFKSKKISYNFKSEFSEYICYFDPAKVEMIATNIVSNSLKNTPQNGNISLNISISNSLDELKHSRIYLKFSDTGEGMSREMMERVTEPFYKSNNEENGGNSGLGLALVKSLTEFLQGSLSINSEFKKGTEIAIEFPLLLKQKNEEDSKQVNGNKTLQIDELFSKNLETNDFFQVEKKSNFKILIAEDNLELMKFLKKHFSNKFQVLTAKDGAQALEKLKDVFPDVIISDIKMPKISGIQLCEKVKSAHETKHIPFILLTAKNDETLKLRALRSGANAYLEKPFNLNELDLVVNNLLETGKNLEKRFSNKDNNDPTSIPRNNQDREFLRKISSIVEKSYSDPKFGVESLSKEAGISRSLLHIKMKKITGLSALEYLKRKRMKKATHLIKQGKNISEVSYQVGYSDPNYFSRAFKKEFNLTPTQFAEEKQTGL